MQRITVPGEPGYDIWVSRRVDGRWSTAEVVPPPVGTGAEEIYPMVVADAYATGTACSCQTELRDL